MVAALSLGVARFCHRETAGFRLEKVQNNTFLAEQNGRNSDVLSQKFTYLARGKQSFVFASADGKYVLKLFNNRYQWWLKILAPFKFLSWAEERYAHFSRQLETVKGSYLLAESALEKETGLLFLHLSQTTHLKQEICIIDKLGIEHKLDADQTGFLIQKRVVPLYVQLEMWIQNKDLTSAKEGISALIALLKTRCAKGIGDKDPLLRTNMGFLGTTPIFLDLGPFSKNLSLEHAKNYRPEILKITSSLKTWLHSHEPSLALYLEEELQRLLSS